MILKKFAYHGLADDGKSTFYIESAAPASEDKPTPESVGGDIAPGSIHLEPDTGTVYFWDPATETWVEQFSFQG